MKLYRNNVVCLWQNRFSASRVCHRAQMSFVTFWVLTSWVNCIFKVDEFAQKIKYKMFASVGFMKKWISNREAKVERYICFAIDCNAFELPTRCQWIRKQSHLNCKRTLENASEMWILLVVEWMAVYAHSGHRSNKLTHAHTEHLSTSLAKVTLYRRSLWWRFDCLGWTSHSNTTHTIECHAKYVRCACSK